MAEKTNPFEKARNSLYKLFGVKYDTSYSGGIRPVEPIKNPVVSYKTKDQVQAEDEMNKITRYKAKKFDSMTKQLFNQWRQLKVTEAEMRERFNLYQEMRTMYMNSALISRAVNMVRDEIIQANENTRVISVESENRKLKEDIEKFLDAVLSNDTIKSTVHNLILYGDAFWFIAFGENGVDEVLEIDPQDVYDRIEFTPIQMARYMRGRALGTNLFSQMTNDAKLKYLVGKIVNKELDDYSAFFKSYLLGYQVSEYIVPPWNCLHFRNYTTDDLFHPFGVPLFLHALFPYKQYELALGFQAMLRQAKMPIDIYRLKAPIGLEPTDALQYMADFIRAFDNSGLRDTKKEDIAIGERIFTFMDLFEFDQKSSNFDLGRIEDIEMMRDDMILATGLPRNMLDPNNGSFGNSGISLVEQFKPFARLVYTYQSIFLSQVTTLVKTHLVLTGNYSLEQMDFTLSMPFPESQTNPEIIQSQSERFRLAGEILDALKIRILGDQSESNLPIEVVKDVFEKVLPYDPQTVSRWIDEVIKEREKQEAERAAENPDAEAETAESPEGFDFTFESKKFFKEHRDAYKIVLKEELKTKLHSLRGNEYKENRRHYFGSKFKNPDFDPALLLKFKEEEVIRLMESKDWDEQFVKVSKKKIKENQKRKEEAKRDRLKEMMEEIDSYEGPDDDIDMNDIVTDDED